MEGLLFIIILVVFNLLRSAGRKQQQQRKAPPPPRPRRTFLDMEPEPELDPEPARDAALQPEARPGPVRRRIFLEENLFRFPKKEEVKPPAFREEPAAIEEKKIGTKRRSAPAVPAADPDKGLELFRDKSDLVRGIILAEVLGPPLSKRKRRGFV